MARQSSKTAGAPKSRADSTPESSSIPAGSRDLIDEIGLSAGVVWRYLEQNGPVSLFQLKKGVDLSSTQVDRAIGWLAREGKCIEERVGSKTLLMHKE